MCLCVCVCVCVHVCGSLLQTDNSPTAMFIDVMMHAGIDDHFQRSLLISEGQRVNSMPLCACVCVCVCVQVSVHLLTQLEY